MSIRENQWALIGNNIRTVVVSARRTVMHSCSNLKLEDDHDVIKVLHFSWKVFKPRASVPSVHRPRIEDCKINLLLITHLDTISPIHVRPQATSPNDGQGSGGRLERHPSDSPWISCPSFSLGFSPLGIATGLCRLWSAAFLLAGRWGGASSSFLYSCFSPFQESPASTLSGFPGLLFPSD